MAYSKMEPFITLVFDDLPKISVLATRVHWKSPQRLTFSDNFNKKKKSCSEWFHCNDDPEQYNKFCSILRVGDIVEIGLYRDGGWAICVEDGAQPKVILHKDSFYELCECSDSQLMENQLTRDRRKFYEVALLKICKDHVLRINNARDKVSPPKPAEEIVRRARESIERSRSNWMKRDSRDFVELARYSIIDLNNRLDKNHCSKWFDMKDLETFRWLLRQGDILEFKKTGYNNHWAVCQSSKLATVVYHYGSDLLGYGPIETSPIEQLIEGSTFRINNSKDNELQVRPQSEIDSIANISWESEETDKHNLLKYDAQKFTEYLRYGPEPLPNKLLIGNELAPTLPNSLAERVAVLEDRF